MKILFLQLPPIAPDGLPARENHPLGAAHLVLAGRRATGAVHDLSLLDRETADAGSDEAILDAVEAARPDALGLTLYVWNIVRALHLAREARRRLPGLSVLAGGPEVVAGRSDLFALGVDIGVQGEGEVPFAALLAALAAGADLRRPETLRGVPGLLLPPAVPGGPPITTGPSAGVASLDLLEDPYAAGLVDAGRDRFLYLETTRGCRFRCSFCRYDADAGGPLKSLSLPRVADAVRHGVDRGVEEVFLLDPTLNQRKDLPDLLRLLAAARPAGGRPFRYGGELVAELVEEEIADLLAAAGFHTVEVGLQSVNPGTLRAIQRFHHREKFLRGVRLLKARGIRVRVDLILGLPLETPASARAGIDFVADEGIGEDIQVFELMVLPGTALAGQAAGLGIEHLPRPPYTVLRTPTMTGEEIAEAVAYSEDRFGVRWTPAPRLRRFRGEERILLRGAGTVAEEAAAALSRHRRNFLAMDARGAPFGEAALGLAEALPPWLARNPFASLDVLLRARGPEDLGALERLVVAMQAPDATLGATLHRRAWTFLDREARARAGRVWLDEAQGLSFARAARGRPPLPARRAQAGHPAPARRLVAGEGPLVGAGPAHHHEPHDEAEGHGEEADVGEGGQSLRRSVPPGEAPWDAHPPHDVDPEGPGRHSEHGGEDPPGLRRPVEVSPLVPQDVLPALLLPLAVEVHDLEAEVRRLQVPREVGVLPLQLLDELRAPGVGAPHDLEPRFAETAGEESDALHRLQGGAALLAGEGDGVHGAGS